MKRKNLPYNVLNLTKNTSPQQILLLLVAVDTSGSMNEVVDNTNGLTRIEMVSKATDEMLRAIAADDILRKSVEVGILTFNTSVKTVRPFATLEDATDAPSFTASGVTKIGEAICTGSELIKKRQEFHLNAAETNVLTPIMLVLSDGVAFESSPTSMADAVNVCSSKAFHTVPVFIGAEEEHAEFLNEIGKPINISQFMIGELFSGIVTATKSSMSTASTEAFEELLKSAISWSTVLVKQ